MDIIERLREMAESPVYGLRRGVLLAAARNLETLYENWDKLQQSTVDLMCFGSSPITAEDCLT